MKLQKLKKKEKISEWLVPWQPIKWQMDADISRGINLTSKRACWAEARVREGSGEFAFQVLV